MQLFEGGRLHASVRVLVIEPRELACEAIVAALRLRLPFVAVEGAMTPPEAHDRVVAPDAIVLGEAPPTPGEWRSLSRALRRRWPAVVVICLGVPRGSAPLYGGAAACLDAADDADSLALAVLVAVGTRDGTIAETPALLAAG
jgi:hypothetical protein